MSDELEGLHLDPNFSAIFSAKCTPVSAPGKIARIGWPTFMIESSVAFSAADWSLDKEIQF
jgi:hypothetical protein